MIRSIPATAALLALAVLAFVGVPTAPALADCADSPSPEVNWRRCLLDGRDLANARLEGAMLRDATFQRANLAGADVSKADGYRAKFISSRLQKARFEEARLIEADFSRSDLSGASFKGADLRNARFFDANLREADFTGARLGGTDFRRADLSGATWIDGTHVCGPQSIGQCN